MEIRSRYRRVWDELSRDKTMVLMAGPRQAGKTTLAKQLAEGFSNSLYFNWDIVSDRQKLLAHPTFFTELERRDSSIPLVIFDEIHKYRDWKNYLKGVVDEFGGRYRFLVSGSGRLEIYQKGGDSLAGRYLPMHLWPLTLAELSNASASYAEFSAAPLQIEPDDTGVLRDAWTRLSLLSGFPEPYLGGRVASYRRWSRVYGRQLIREDVRDMTGIRAIDQLETLYHLLPPRVGSPLSIQSLSRDLKVAYNTVATWLGIFERFYLTFELRPHARKITRAIHKARKIYLWDTPRIEDEAARFENMVAIELFRFVSTVNDLGLADLSLSFVRNKEQQEVDFLITERNAPVLLVEAKLSEDHPSAALVKFQKQLSVPAVQLTEGGETHRRFGDDILVAPAHQWLARLP